MTWTADGFISELTAIAVPLRSAEMQRAHCAKAARRHFACGPDRHTFSRRPRTRRSRMIFVLTGPYLIVETDAGNFLLVDLRPGNQQVLSLTAESLENAHCPCYRFVRSLRGICFQRWILHRHGSAHSLHSRDQHPAVRTIRSQANGSLLGVATPWWRGRRRRRDSWASPGNSNSSHDVVEQSGSSEKETPRPSSRLGDESELQGLAGARCSGVSDHIRQDIVKNVKIP